MLKRGAYVDDRWSLSDSKAPFMTGGPSQYVACRIDRVLDAGHVEYQLLLLTPLAFYACPSLSVSEAQF